MDVIDNVVPKELTVSYKPLYDVYHIFDFGYVELRIYFVRYF